ncbi:winged helix-turn-helix domain-containing tetratricopeptide repeat protein [Neoroseomonas oryzicola]|uniref:Tetratricopeptide repeat protein n=1 Tax=Neoroseomonas oryzicola TaxID=535904 RepID=A0A9X9WIE4_9PROT|nr:winged helix-turn-helix domain-containing protein [Neoroseomonas oryzicola]MBR0660104.1 tetratricopeptide repeat protein [Neoroseomonas oryzicola]NKE18175.1 tetratricopeptide repeat protein [Neoroseomonas oryzicola]
MPLSFAGHEVDLRRQELRRDGSRVHVEPQVFDLIVHLLRNRDRVVSKDELLDTIWNGRIVSEAALSSRINAARKAVGDDGDRQSLIKTIHKRGFRFVGEVTEEAEDDVAEIPAPEPPVASPSTRPSVVVLPFANLSSEPDTDYFSYGLTEDVIRLLARHRWMDVLSRHTAAAFRGREVDAREIGTTFGVRYLVHGSVAKRGERVRLAADLVSAKTGAQLWSETYDLALADVLDVQRAMAEQIAAAIEPELARLEREAAVRRPPTNLGAWDCYQRGLFHLWGFTQPGMAEAEAMFRRAVELDPAFARAQGALAYVLLQETVVSERAGREALLEEAMRLSRSAVALDNQDCMNLCVLGRVHAFRHDYEEAIALLEQSVALNPSFAQAHFALGCTKVWSGRAREGIADVERAAELSPRDPHLSSFYATRAFAHITLGEYAEAVEYGRRATRVPNAKAWPYLMLIAALGLMDRIEEARRVVAALIEKEPDYTLEVARSDFFFCADQAVVDRCLDGLRRAGLPGGD